jgi:hypothetical protein
MNIVEEVQKKLKQEIKAPDSAERMGKTAVPLKFTILRVRQALGLLHRHREAERRLHPVQIRKALLPQNHKAVWVPLTPLKKYKWRTTAHSIKAFM